MKDSYSAPPDVAIMLSPGKGRPMGIRDALAAVGRRWYVLLAVMLVFGALTYAFYKDGGSYYTRTTVTFSLPSRSTLLPESGMNDTSIVAFAGAIATSINDGRPVQTFSSSDAPYYGAGAREGVMVSLRNTGSQWISSFPTATIDIQIVGRTHEWVQERQQDLLSQIAQVTQAQQDATVTPESNQITGTIQPLSTEIQEIRPGRSEMILAVSAMSIAALVVGIPSAVLVDRAIRRRRNKRARGRAAVPVRAVRTEGRIA